MQLLSVAPASVMHKLEELEQQAAREDSGVLEKATRSTNATAVRNGGQLWKEQAAKDRVRSRPVPYEGNPPWIIW
jgi:hypothetical protein